MAVKSKALILAVNDYESVSPLRGCLNDARDMAKLLTSAFDFPGDNVKLLVDREVRKSRINPLLKWLYEDMGPGDRVALHFSGHGSRVADEDKDETGDSLDEILCLQDMDFDRSTTYLVDDDLGKWTKRCPAGVNLTVFLDCCHSGTGTRKLIPPSKTKPSLMYPRIVESTTAQRVAEQRLGSRALATGVISLEMMSELARGLAEATPQEQVFARFVDPPEQIQQKVQLALESKPRSTHDTIEIVTGLNHLLLAACQDDQTAADAYIDGEFHGAFSYHLCRIYGEAGRALDRNEAITRLARALRDNRYEQIPRLETSKAHGGLFAPGADEPSVSDSPPAPTPPSPTPPRPHDGDSAAPPPQRPVTDLTLPTRIADGADVYAELLATYNRLLDLIQPGLAGRPATALAARAANRQLVYVHGIGRHRPGYSNGWWAAMAQFTPSLHPGALGVNRHEVLWSDIVNSKRALRGIDETAAAEAERLSRQIREEVIDRLDQTLPLQTEVAAARGVGVEAPEPVDRVAIRGQLERGLFDGLDDFTLYMTNDDVRREILAEFHRVVRSLLRQGAVIDLITHSWGTVVAFEGLRQLEADSSIAPGSVHTFFTVGSALSIPAVRWNLSGRIPDGRKPASVSRWINVDASGDLVGGAIQEKGFGVDVERLNLPATGCRWFPPDPVCAHSSYFNPQNLNVNSDIFGAWIESR